MKKLEQLKQFGRLIAFIFKTTWRIVRDKRTWILAFLILSYYVVFNFSNNNIVQSPVKEWQPMIVPRYTTVKKLTVTPMVVAQVVKPTPVPLTEEQIVKGAKYGEELWKIYMLESTRGKNDGCRKSGEGFAGFGVMSLGKPACYESFEKAVERASYWYEKVRKGNTLDEALCIWNLGQKQPMCHYSMSYHSLP